MKNLYLQYGEITKTKTEINIKPIQSRNKYYNSIW